MISKDVGMALVYKVRIQGSSDNTAPFPRNHSYTTVEISASCNLQLLKHLACVLCRPVPSLHHFDFFETIFILLVCVIFFVGKHTVYSNIYTGTAYSYREKPQLVT